MSEPAAEPRSWVLHTDRGLALHVPDDVSNLNTFVLLELEHGHEPEAEALTRLIDADTVAVDFGADHGLYALELARHLTHGQVLALEPEATARARLRQSVERNGLQSRALVLDPQDDGVGAAPGRPATLDSLARGLAGGRPVGLVRLDPRQALDTALDGGEAVLSRDRPIVLAPGDQTLGGATARLEALGYALFTYLPELDLLAPIDLLDEAGRSTRPCWCIPLSRVAELARRRLLAEDEAVRHALPLLSAPPTGASVYLQALRRTIAGHTERDQPAAHRLAAMLQARDELQSALNAGDDAGPEAWALLVHLMHALGQTTSALELARELLSQWDEALPVSRPIMPPQRLDIDLPRTQPDAAWLRLRLAEFVEFGARRTSWWSQPEPSRLATLTAQPDHRPALARLQVLAHLRRDQAPPAALLQAVANHPGTVNADLWREVARQFAATESADRAKARVIELLANLQDGPVQIVDVGASRLGEEREPYAPLLAAGLARVTAFEPDDGARAELENAFASAGTHRILPHFVGRGGPATFHETAWFMTSSLLAPNEPLLARYDGLLPLSRGVATHPVQTRRLDDLIGLGEMDLLKIDVQGAESQVFDGAVERLADCLMVWTEVEFVPLYQDQPLFGDVDRQLRALGFEFHSLTGIGQRRLDAWATTRPAKQGRQQWLWADAVYVMAAPRRRALGDAALARFALLAHAVLQACDLCHEALGELDRRRGSDHARRYAEAVDATVRA